LQFIHLIKFLFIILYCLLIRSVFVTPVILFNDSLIIF